MKVAYKFSVEEKEKIVMKGYRNISEELFKAIDSPITRISFYNEGNGKGDKSLKYTEKILKSGINVM